MNFILKNTIAFLILILTSCTVQNKDDNSIFEIIYEARTRGSEIKIEFKNGTLFFKSNSEEKSIVLNDAQINDIQNVAQEIKLTKIADLIAPSNKRFSDKALSANFIIKKNDISYISSDFDHGNPPKELKELYLILEKYIQ
jgi:hypothetical protein